MKLTTTQLRRIIKEEVEAMMPAAGDKDPQRFLHGFESGHPMDDEGYMVKSRMSDVKDMAETICNLIEMGDQLPAWVQDLVASAHTDLEHVKDYLEGDEKMRSYQQSAPVSLEKFPMPMGESRNRKAKGLNEAHARITEEEMKAWMRGDWGFVSEKKDPEVPDDYEQCDECGYDHEYEPKESAAAHKKLDNR
jgi:hypothetical protein